MKKIQVQPLLFFLAAVLILFPGFYRNQWNAATPGKFKDFQFDDQSLVMGRLVETRKSGLFSYGGLLGRGDIDLYGGTAPTADFEAMYAHQYDIYLKGKTFSAFRVYGSQSGAQGMLLGMLDLISPFSPTDNMRAYHVLMALSFAITIGLWLLWFMTEFGVTAGLVALFGAAASPWLTFFARNLFYVPTFFFIPIVAVTWYLHHHSIQLEQGKFKFGLLIFATILLKCLFNGFDFILPSILMIGAPYVYFALRDKWDIRKFIRIGIVIAIGVTAAILVALAILSLQLWAALGSFSEGVGYIASTFGRRTLGNPDLYPEYAASLRVSAWDVLKMYFERKLAVGQTPVRFVDLFAAFALFTGSYFLVEKLRKGANMDLLKTRALVIATWASMFSPLLWYVIFKGQSYMHPHTNFLSWYMPFVIFGFALCGYILQNLYASFTAK